MTLEQARKMALETLHKMSGGINPIDQKREKNATTVTLNEAHQTYLKARKELKAGTINDYNKAMKETFSDWMNKPLQWITKDKVIKRHAERGAVSKARANNAFRVLRAIFNFAKHHYEDSKESSLFPENPVEKLSATKAWFKVKRKQSYITPTELPKWYEAVNSLENISIQSKADVVKDYFLFLLFTGIRREEAASLSWENVDLNEKTFTLIDTKNSEVVTLPMSNFVFKLLQRRYDETESNYVFQGDGAKGYLAESRKQLLRVRKLSGITFSLHDLRRTFATVGDSLDISPYTLKRLLNHKINHEADVTSGYVVLSPERLRSASQRISDALLGMMRGV